MSINKQQVRTALAHVIHPKYGKDLVTLNLIQDLIVQDKFITFTIDLPEKTPELDTKLKKMCEDTLRKYVDDDLVLDIQTAVNLSKKRELEGDEDAGGEPAFPGQGHREKKQQKPPQQQGDEELLQGVDNIIAVASGKGGVGKSTVAVNLACGLARTGAKVGLLDTDIYGPSIPTMMDTHERPNITTQKKLIPLEKYGVKFVSMGLLVDPDQAMIWRGPMVTSAVKQFMQEVVWGDLDYLVLDLPPGTGDVQLTIVQTVPLTGAIVVSTPQNVALDDARKGVAMFKKVSVPVLGIVENMAYFVPPDMPDKKYHIFGEHGARDLAERMGINFLGEIPLEQSVRESGDAGKPIVLQDVESKSAQAFIELSNNTIQQLALRNKEQGPTEKIDIKIKP
ncbi:Mrp/NBP35 family ATP-binding protein [Aliifodinibius sp. S!AR15-10]|uniref:Mrp/NBP35 family ATP-binding protein n=1 Tax=Aliifodinibius sp. S!AR15-10 TaxID=2950437 RepID=UPI002858BD15|nr:Mrp/NBP35 family ATP-binding protein [Aliifodinibius sp. S!AR15-10]MDR8391513.1 Mrp/NBP35 family ATP-binding protein [Aliifodinibius sp. S!AR15-10]